MSEVETHFIAHCPDCGAGLKVRRVYLGKEVRCNRCDATFVALEDTGTGGDMPGETLIAAGPVPWPQPAPEPEPERVVVSCPSCAASLNVRRAYIGLQVTCKRCEKPFVVSEPGREPAPAIERGSAALQAELEQLRSWSEHMIIMWPGI